MSNLYTLPNHKLMELFYLSHIGTRFLSMSLFSSKKKLQIFSNSPSYQILRHMHEALNIDKKDN